MQQLVHLTDIHLNFCHPIKISNFAGKILGEKPDAVVITGDISEAPSLVGHLLDLKSFLTGIPVYFICGNHDYYNGSINKVRDNLANLFGPGNQHGIYWLQADNVVSLSADSAIVGHDGWYDGGYPGYGDFFTSRLDMSDFYVINDLSIARMHSGRSGIYQKMQELSKQGADHVLTNLPKAFENHDKVFYATHVSPFAECSRAPDGSISDKDWMPTFCSKLTGEAVLSVMKKMPANKQLVILCGHSHTEWVHKPMSNVTCYCGGAGYGRPAISKFFDY
jgi:Icc-related predicted phosphoesterase